MALIEIDGLPSYKMVDLSMANCECHNQMVYPLWVRPRPWSQESLDSNLVCEVAPGQTLDVIEVTELPTWRGENLAFGSYYR